MSPPPPDTRQFSMLSSLEEALEKQGAIGVPHADLRARNVVALSAYMPTRRPDQLLSRIVARAERSGIFCNVDDG